jgi:uncharacterized membrane protein YdjX (TVP38/TMEM64 family)
MLPYSWRWGLLLTGLCVLVILPFAAFGSTLEAWVAALVHSPRAIASTAVMSVVLLAADIVLPIPSSLVLTTSGLVLGWGAGTLVGATGLTLGCLIGYGLGRIAGRVGARRLLDRDGDDSVGSLLNSYGLVFLVSCRAVPVLAEASIIAAGIGRIPPLKCLAAASLANIGVAAVYASIGAWAANASMIGAAFAAAIAIPGLAFATAAWLRRTLSTSPGRR